MTSIHHLSRAEAEAALARQWRVPQRSLAGDSPPDEVVAEYLRAHLTAQCGFDRRRVEPVYVTAVTRRVREQLAPFWQDLANSSSGKDAGEDPVQADPVRRVLEALDDLRDAEHIGHGYWLPTPVRLVSLSSETALVVGGRPTADLEALLDCKVSRTWITRTVSRDDLPTRWLADQRRWQPLDEWMGSPPRDLSAWLAAERKRARANLLQSSSDVRDFEVYWPPIARPAEPQWFRWLDPRELAEAPDDLVLCRTRGGYFSQRRYWWGTLTGGPRGLRPKREAAIPPRALRRIQYAIDMQHENPTAARLDPDDDGVVVVLRSAVPAEERRLLFALSTDVSERPGRYPIRLRVPRRHVEAVQRSLTTLGIRLIRRQWSGHEQ